MVRCLQSAFGGDGDGSLSALPRSEHPISGSGSNSAASLFSLCIDLLFFCDDASTLLLTAFIYLGRTPYAVGNDESRDRSNDDGNLTHCGHHHGFMFGVSPSNAAADEAAPPPILR